MPRHLFPILFSAAALCAAYTLWPQTAAEVSLPQGACYLPREFTLQWRHSVEHQLWREDYFSDGQMLHLSRTQMQTFGAGMPSDGLTVTADKGFVAQQGRLKLPELNWVVSRNMQGEIRFKGRVWPIAAALPDYSNVRIVPTRKPRAFIYFGICL